MSTVPATAGRSVDATAAAAGGQPGVTRRAAPASYMHGEDAEHLEVYAASADAIAIVGNTEFAFHTQVVAGHSKVVAKMLQDVAGGAAAAAAGGKRKRGGGGAEAGEPEGDGLLRLPFDGISADTMTCFLMIAYSRGGDAVSAAVTKFTGASDYAALAELLELSDKLHCSGLSSKLDGSLSSRLACYMRDAAVDSWMPVLALADRERRLLPKSYKAAVGRAVRALVPIRDRDSVEAFAIQRFVGHELFKTLSPSAMADIMLSSVATTQAQACLLPAPPNTHVALSASAARFMDNLGSASLTFVSPEGNATAGSHLWEWKPGCGLESEDAKAAQQSPEFEIGGVKWRLRVHLNGESDRSRRHVSVCLEPVAAAGCKAARRAAYALAVKGGKGAVHKAGKHWFEKGGWSCPKFCTHADLKEKKLMTGGAIRVEVQLSELEVFDM